MNTTQRCEKPYLLQLPMDCHNYISQFFEWPAEINAVIRTCKYLHDLFVGVGMWGCQNVLFDFRKMTVKKATFLPHKTYQSKPLPRPRLFNWDREIIRLGTYLFVKKVFLSFDDFMENILYWRVLCKFPKMQTLSVDMKSIDNHSECQAGFDGFFKAISKFNIRKLSFHVFKSDPNAEYDRDRTPSLVGNYYFPSNENLRLVKEIRSLRLLCSNVRYDSQTNCFPLFSICNLKKLAHISFTCIIREGGKTLGISKDDLKKLKSNGLFENRLQSFEITFLSPRPVIIREVECTLISDVDFLEELSKITVSNSNVEFLVCQVCVGIHQTKKRKKQFSNRPVFVCEYNENHIICCEYHLTCGVCGKTSKELLDYVNCSKRKCNQIDKILCRDCSVTLKKHPGDNSSTIKNYCIQCFRDMKSSKIRCCCPLETCCHHNEQYVTAWQKNCSICNYALCEFCWRNCEERAKGRRDWSLGWTLAKEKKSSPLAETISEPFRSFKDVFCNDCPKNDTTIRLNTFCGVDVITICSKCEQNSRKLWTCTECKRIHFVGSHSCRTFCGNCNEHKCVSCFSVKHCLNCKKELSCSKCCHRQYSSTIIMDLYIKSGCILCENQREVFDWQLPFLVGVGKISFCKKECKREWARKEIIHPLGIMNELSIHFCIVCLEPKCQRSSCSMTCDGCSASCHFNSIEADNGTLPSEVKYTCILRCFFCKETRCLKCLATTIDKDGKSLVTQEHGFVCVNCKLQKV